MKGKQLEEYSRQNEEAVKEFWKKKGIAEKVRKQNAKAKQGFYMMDGPPYATGHIHMGTAMNKILKDVVMRSQRMQGKNVFDRPGYDTHGLPIENKVEQKLGFKTKQDIENYGVKKFVDECRRFATEFIDVMNAEFDGLGAWMDWKNPYLTLSDGYIDAIWWTFKKAHEKGLLYLGKYPVHVCPHCETAVAYNEIEYTKQTDTSVYVKFRVKDSENRYLVIWTTTPWTLPGNTGVMAHPNFDYVEAKMSNGESWIVAKERLEPLMKAIEAGYKVEKTFKGKTLENLEYENPLAKHLKLPRLKGAFRVILSERYVNLEDGTGLVHSAPGHGKEDFDAGSKAGLPAISPVGLNGLMTGEAGKYAGKKARVVDEEIIADLEAEGALVYKHPFSHDYPICWRCKSPLLMLSVPQWFFKISSIQKKMLELNETVYWVPGHMKDRMKNWLEQLGDWPISRARYWGTPLPIWICSDCLEKIVIGSIKELKGLSGKEAINVHKPEIDDVRIKCKCSGEMQRVPEVLDVWFDSGVSSWAALGYPSEKKLFEKFWPADINLEGTDQFRGWWNSELITSTICFNDKPFKAISVHGLVLDLGKQKMSKSRGNAVQPQEVMEKYNRDYLRHYIIKNSKGADIVFDWEAFKDIHRFYNIFLNACNYMNLYLEIDLSKKAASKKGLETEDKWLLSRLNSLQEKALESYNKYVFFDAIAAIEQFILEDLSRTYIKLVRERVGTKSQKAVEETLSICLSSLLRMLAPIAPHISEYIYQDMKSKKMPESVHLLELPGLDKKAIDKELEKQFETARRLSEAALALREGQKMKLRWPLKELVVQSKKGKELKKVLGVLAKTVNVKKCTEAKKKPKGKFALKEAEGGFKLFLNVEADAALKDEWELMELRRRIQEARKQAKLNPNQKAKLLLGCSDAAFAKKFKAQLEKDTNTKIQLLEAKGKAKMERLLERQFSIAVKK